MSATPGCPTPAPVPPCPLRQARYLQPHHTTHTHTQRYTPKYVATPAHLLHNTTSHTPPICNTITTKDSLRTFQVQRCQRHQVAQRRRQCRHALCAKPIRCNHTTPHTHTALQPEVRRHTSTPGLHNTTSHTPPMCNTITTKDSLRTSQVQRCQRHQLAQRWRQCRHALCVKPIPCNYNTHSHSVTA